MKAPASGNAGANTICFIRIPPEEEPLAFPMRFQTDRWAPIEREACTGPIPAPGWDEFRSFSCPVKPVTGVKTLFLVFASDIPGSRVMDVKDISFS